MRHLIIIIFATLALSFPAFSKPPAEAFGQLPKVYDAAISPDGSRLAAFVNMGGSYGLGIFYIDNSGRKPMAVGLAKGVKPQWVTWANDEIVLGSFWESHNYGSTPITTGHLYSLNANTQEGQILVQPNNGKSVGSRMGRESFFRQFNNDVIDMLRSDPDHILMSFSDENVIAPDVQKVNVRTGEYTRIRRGSANIQEWYTDLRGEIRVGQGLADKSTEKWTLRIRDKDDDNKWSSYKDYPGLKGNETIYGFTSNPDEMIVGRYNGKNTMGLYVYDLSQKQITRKIFHNDTYDVSGIVLSNDGSEIVGASYVSENNETELFGSRQSSLDRLRQKYPKLSVDYIDSTPDYSDVIIKISGPSEPGGIYLMDSKTLDLSRISPMYDDIKGQDLGEVVSIKYTARDGQKIPAFVTIPGSVSGKPQGLPFIILPHGGPYARDSKRFDYLAQFFASRGYGVMQMNFRGSVGYGKEFEEAGRKNWVVMQEDVEDGTRWLIEKGYADPARTCIAGWSYGGYAALIAKIKNPDLYACTISMAGVTDLKDLINDMKKYRFGKITARGFLKGFSDKDNLKENSPVKRAAEMTGPVFMAHGTLDQRVHYDQFKRMKSALKKSDAKLTTLTFKDEDHFLSNEENRKEFFEALDKFLAKSIGESEFVQ